jgi:hypothetical protein
VRTLEQLEAAYTLYRVAFNRRITGILHAASQYHFATFKRYVAPSLLKLYDSQGVVFVFNRFSCAVFDWFLEQPLAAFRTDRNLVEWETTRQQLRKPPPPEALSCLFLALTLFS